MERTLSSAELRDSEPPCSLPGPNLCAVTDVFYPSVSLVETVVGLAPRVILKPESRAGTWQALLQHPLALGDDN